MNSWDVGFMALIMAGTLCFSAVAFYRVWRGRQACSGREVWLFLGVCALAFAVRMWAVPHLHHVYFDEFNYLSEAQNLRHSGVLGSLLKGSATEVEQATSGSMRPGYALWLAFASALSDPGGRRSAEVLATEPLFIANILLGVLSVALGFWIVWRSAGSLRLAFGSALVLALLPCHIKYSASLSADTAVLFFFLLFLGCLLEWRKRRERVFLLAALCAGAFSSCIKPAYFVFVCIGLAAVIGAMHSRREVSRQQLKDLLYYFACFFVPLALLLCRLLRVERELTNGPLYSFDYLAANLKINWEWFFRKSANNVVAAYLCLIGSVSVVMNRRPVGLAMLVWFWLGFFIISAYYAGSLAYVLTTDSDRFFFIVALPFSFLAAVGFEAILQPIARWRALAFTLAAGIVFLLSLNGIATAAKISHFTYQRHLYARHVFMGKLAPQIPQDAYLVTDAPTLLTTVSSRKALFWPAFQRGDHPLRIVYSNDSECTRSGDGVVMGPEVRKYYDCDLLFRSSSAKPQCAFEAFSCQRKPFYPAITAR